MNNHWKISALSSSEKIIPKQNLLRLFMLIIYLSNNSLIGSLKTPSSIYNISDTANNTNKVTKRRWAKCGWKIYFSERCCDRIHLFLLTAISVQISRPYGVQKGMNNMLLYVIMWNESVFHNIIRFMLCDLKFRYEYGVGVYIFRHCMNYEISMKKSV